MKENRLLIHLAHLELAKPTEMPVEAHEEPEITHRCKMQTCISFLSIKSLSLSLSLTLYVFPAPTFQTLVFCHLELSVSYHRPSSPWTWRVCACTVFVSYHQSALLISPPFYAQDFSLFPRLLSACFYFSTVAHNKVLHRLVLLQGH